MEDLTGRKFNRLTVTRYAYKKQPNKHYWLCLCDCQSYTVVRGDYLRAGKIKSCSCLQRSLKDSDAPIREAYRHKIANAQKLGIRFELTFDRYKYLMSLDCHYCGKQPILMGGFNSGCDYRYYGCVFRANVNANSGAT
jgi:hypothetical protein